MLRIARRQRSLDAVYDRASRAATGTNARAGTAGPTAEQAEAEQVDGSEAETPSVMTAEEAVSWLRGVDGELYRTPPGRRGREAWVAVVRTPSCGSRASQTIVALGETLEEAASTAARKWHRVFREVGRLH